MDLSAPLSEAQEEQRREGLRILARIIARHYLEHPELYSTDGEKTVPTPREQERHAMTNQRGQASNREERR